MALTIPDIANGDNVITATNANNALIEAAINNADGANLVDGSVTNAKLAKNKSLFTISGTMVDPTAGASALALNETITAFEFILPQLDGAAATYTYLGCSVCIQTVAGLTATFDVQKVSGGVTSTMHGAPFALGGFVSGTPAYTAASGTQTLGNGDSGQVVFTWTAGTATNVSYVLYFSVAHVSS